MKRKLFLLFLLIYSADVFAGVDTVIVPIQRQYFHERIREEQKLIDRMDGKTDGFIKVSANDEVNHAVTDIIFQKVRQLSDSVELNAKISGNNFLKGLNAISYTSDLRTLVFGNTYTACGLGVSTSGNLYESQNYGF